MSEYSITKAREILPEIVKEAKKEAVKLTKHGKCVGVVLDPSIYETLIEAWEELEDIADFDRAMAEPDEWISLETFLKESGV